MTRSEHITTAEAQAWLDAPDAPTVLDVRTPAEYAGTHIEGSVNAPLDLLEHHAHRIGSSVPGDVLLVCRTDRRAHAAAKLLAPTMGGRVHVLDGGMTDWEKEHRDVARGDGGPWAMERQVRTVAGALAVTGIVASTVAPKAKWLSAGIGAGLFYAGVSDTCAMAKVLGKMPWNQADNAPTAASVVDRLAHRTKEN